MMKICSFCKKELEVSLFCKNSTQKDGLSTYCNDCKREYNKKYYLNKTDEQKNRSKEWTKQRIKEIDDIINKYKIKCFYCDENTKCCLDFHHVDASEKEFNISNMRARAKCLKGLEKEIQKCIVVCSNCHRKIHAGHKL